MVRAPAARDVGKGFRALAVDAERPSAVELGNLLAGAGFEVVVEDGPVAARERCAVESFDLAVLDEQTGATDLAHRLVEGGCAVIVTVADPRLASPAAALRHGVTDYASRPLDAEDLLARVTRAMEAVALRRANGTLVAALEAKNRELQELVVRDPVTRLFNHAYFHESLQREVVRSERHGLELSLVLVDVDDFKKLNDALGHAVGDEVVGSLAALLRGDGKEADLRFRIRTGDVAARYGGDQFALILPETPKSGAAVQAERLRAHVEGGGLGPGLPRVTISAGVASFPSDGADRDSLVRRAVTALVAAKRAGRNRLVTFGPELEAEASGHVAWELLSGALARTLDQLSFDYHYQPIVRAGDSSIFAYEGLCRPRDPAFRSPPQLFSTAERAGRIVDLGRVLRARCVGPMDRLPEGCLLFVNLHPLELFDPALGAGEQHLLPWASRIVFEITETSELRDPARVRAIIDRLREQGFRVALDDLGAGYAGLNSLALLAPDFVKLDISLVRSIEENPRTMRLVRHIVEYARDEGMQVVAEGVETASQAQAVAALGVDFMQGYHFCRPAPPFPQVHIGA